MTNEEIARTMFENAHEGGTYFIDNEKLRIVKLALAQYAQAESFKAATAGDKPVALKIGGLVFRIEYIARLLDVEGITKLNGNILYNPCLIRVEAENDEQMQAITVIHEALHGILTLAGIDKDHEKLVEILAYGLFDVLRGNPTLIEWLENI